MHAGVYYDSVPTGLEARPRHTVARPLVGSIMTIGRRLVHGRKDAPLSPRLLNDIGVSCADVAALSL